MTIEIGKPAPDFTLPSEKGDVTLSALRPRKVVVYFYPKDDTPGCTTEGIDFTRLLPEFEKADTVVLGISKDTLERHSRFCRKHDLGVTLLSDADSDVCERFGVWGEKRLYGKTYMGIERATFLIDGDGIVRRIWRKVRVPGHAEEVLEAARAL